MIVHHVADAAAWQDALESGRYEWSTRGLRLDEVGFVHCARPEQVAGVLERFYAGVTDPLVLLVVDTDRLTSPWREEPVPGGELFAHVYGPLDLDAVVEVRPLRG